MSWEDTTGVSPDGRRMKVRPGEHHIYVRVGPYGPGAYSPVTSVTYHSPGEHPDSPVRNSLAAIHVHSERGSLWGTVPGSNPPVFTADQVRQHEENYVRARQPGGGSGSDSSTVHGQQQHEIDAWQEILEGAKQSIQRNFHDRRGG